MIANTVIVFLRDILPIFILYSYISAMSFKPIQNASFAWAKLSILGILTTLILYSFIEAISESFAGAGIEVFYSAALTVMWLSLSIATLLSNKHENALSSLLLAAGIVVFITLKGAGFLIYFGVSGQTSSNLFSVFLGCVIGIGICISFSLLLKFLLSEIAQSRSNWPLSFLWYAFLAGQFSQVIGLLSQVDYINDSPPLFAMNAYINDASEYGHVLNALLGYESSPSLAFIGFYLTVLCLPIGLQLLLQKSPLHTLLEGNK